jgi:hypothetical protein
LPDVAIVVRTMRAGTARVVSRTSNAPIANPTISAGTANSPTLRHVERAFEVGDVASARGDFAIVSSSTRRSPTA